MVSQEIKLTNDSPVAVNFHASGRSNVGFNILVRSKESLTAKLDKAEKVPVPSASGHEDKSKRFLQLCLENSLAAAERDLKFLRQKIDGA
jgi:hypothetical protein